MADFNFYLNRQGIQGRKGDKGETGFSPTITVLEQTPESYKLQITNEYETIETPNLIGSFNATDNGGTYVRYDREAKTMSLGELDSATVDKVGGIKISSDEDIQNMNTDTAITPEKLADALSIYLEAGTDNVSIVQDEATSKTKISVTGSGGSGDVTAAGNNRFTGDNTFTGKVNIAGGALTVDGVANLNQTTAQYLNAVNITSTGEVNAASIKANGLRSDDIQTTENKKYLTELDVDNQTIQVVNGKLHANLDDLSNEVNDLSGRVTVNEADIATMKTSLSMKQTKLTAGANITLTDLTDGTVRIDSAGGGGTGDIPIATTTTAGKVKPDGTTITITDDGTISAVGGGGSTPANMVTTDTEQEISGLKTFTYLGSSFDGNIYPSLKIRQLTIGETPAITPLSAFQASNGLEFYVSNSNKKLGMSADNTQNTFSLYTNANELKINSDGQVTLMAGNQGTLIINNGLKFKDYYQKEYDLLNATPTVIDGGDSTTV